LVEKLGQKREGMHRMYMDETFLTAKSYLYAFFEPKA